tara:strand:- start:94026 stop:94745 length:720 start_codon:yes stop_codon:yes gene_type:complete
MKVCLVIPCYNEEKRLDIQSFVEFAKENDHYDLLFVNDGSMDKTIQILEELSKNHHNIESLDLKKNQGKAEAVRLGFLHGVNKGIYDYIGFWDADLATPCSELKNFDTILVKNQFEIVMGSRVLRLGGMIERKWYRHLLGRLFATVASVSLKLPVYDTQCGAKFFKANIIEHLFNEKFISYWIFDVEILFKYTRAEKNALKKIYELPLNEWRDVAGSKLSFFDFFKAPIELINICRRYK